MALNEYSTSRFVYCTQALSGTDCRRWENFSAGFPPDEKFEELFFLHFIKLKGKNRSWGDFFKFRGEMQRKSTILVVNFTCFLVQIFCDATNHCQLYKNVQHKTPRLYATSRCITYNWTAKMFLHYCIPLISNYTCQHVDTKTVFL